MARQAAGDDEQRVDADGVAGAHIARHQALRRAPCDLDQRQRAAASIKANVETPAMPIDFNGSICPATRKLTAARLSEPPYFVTKSRC